MALMAGLLQGKYWNLLNEMRLTNNHKAFLDLVRAGLWEQNVQLSQYGKIDFFEVCRLAEEQSVVGLVAAGIEHIVDVKIPQMVALQLAGKTMQIEQRNKEMNLFIADLIAKMQNADIYVLLVKGQGVAQCYERSLWRVCGDVDLFLDADNYQEAKTYFSAKGENIDESPHEIMHAEMTIDVWSVELHGTLRTQLGQRIDKVVDEVQEDTFKNGGIRIWKDGLTDVLLPSHDNDVVFVFTHFLQHFFIGGCGLRQICDWCRLLWTYRGTLDVALLEKRLKNAGLLSEWKAFASLAVSYLGMPVEVMPLYNSSRCWKRKASRILDSILMMGNMGHNRDTSYLSTDKGLQRKLKTLYYISKDACRDMMIFPIDSIRIWYRLVVRELKRYTL